MGGHKLTNLTQGSASTDSVNYSQLTSFVPPGAMFPYAGSGAPSGWLLCDASIYASATYPALSSAIGTAYNTGGEGAGNFRVPDYRGRALVGADNFGTGAASRITNATVNSPLRGGAGGFETITLDATMIPSHTHTANVTDPTHNHTETTVTGTTAGAGGLAVANGPIGSTTGSSSTGITVTNTSTGGGLAHDNLQPTLLCLVIIKT